MKITQIQLPKTIDSTIVALAHLAEEDNVYVTYWPSNIIVEKYGCDPSPRMRSFSKVWKNAIEKDTTERIACNLLNGHSALVRIE